MKKKIKIPTKNVKNLKIGDVVYLTGVLFTMRDNAHRRALEYLKKGKALPINLKNQTIWHCGPIIKKVKDKYKVVVAGSTTSYRLNGVTPLALEKFGYKIVIGKGGMDVEESMKKNKAVYLATVGGTAAWLGQKIESVDAVYWQDLGMPSAIWKFKVKNFGPLIVSIDSKGRNLHKKINKQVKAMKI